MLQRVARVFCAVMFCVAIAAPAAQAIEPDGALIRLTTNGYTYRIVGADRYTKDEDHVSAVWNGRFRGRQIDGRR